MGIKISIITPSFNQGEFIKRTIDSVLNQNIEDLELLVIDGGSTDNTIDILKGYGDKVKWVSEPDKGQTDAVNKGIKMSSGDIIGWLNSDDIYFDGAIKKVLEVFDENTDVNIIYGNAEHIDANDKYIEDYYTEEWNYERLKDVCFICQPSVFFRRSIVEKYGLLNADLKYCMDYEYWLRIGKHENFYHIDSKLAGSRLYETNKTLGSRRKVHEEIIRMLKQTVGLVPSKWIYNLAHVISDEEGLKRDKPVENYYYTRNMVKNAYLAFLRYSHYIPLNELRNMASWVISAKRSIKK